KKNASLFLRGNKHRRVMKFPDNIPLPMPYGWFFIRFRDKLRAGETARLFYFNRHLQLQRLPSGELQLQDTTHRQAMSVVEVNGIIWAWYHPENIPPLFEVHRMPELDSGEWMPYQKAAWTINTCIQETGENAVDTAHFYYVHKLPEIDAQPRITYEQHRRTSELVLALDKFDVEGKKCGHLESRVITACCGPGQTWTRSFGLSDFLIIGLPTPVTEQQIELHFACSL